MKKDAIPKIFVSNDPSANTYCKNQMKRKTDSVSLASDAGDSTNENYDGKKRRMSNIFDHSVDAVEPVGSFTKPAQRSNTSHSCDNCENLKADKKTIYQDYIELEAKRCVEVATLENEIKKLKMDAEIRKQHIKYLSAKLHRKEKSEESLKNLLKDLQEQNILSAQAYEALEVCIPFPKTPSHAELLYDYEFIKI